MIKEDIQVLAAKSQNKLLLFLIAVQLTILLGITLFLIASLTGNVLSITTVLSYVLLLLLSLPLTIVLYLSHREKEIKLLFLALAANFALLSISGILWYILPLTFDQPGIVFVAKIVTVASYAPVIYVLSRLLKAQMRRIELFLKSFIVFVNVVSALLIVYFVVTGLGKSGDWFDILIYAASTIADIIILTTCSLLAIAYMQNQLRYLLAIIFLFFTLSIIGDSLNLLGFLSLYHTAQDSQFFYDLMLISNALFLLIYSLSKVKVTTVEEVNKKLHDSRSLMADLIMQSPDALCIFDTSGDAIMANRAFLQLIGERQPGVPDPVNIFRDADRLMGDSTTLAGIRDGTMVTFEGIKTAGEGNGSARYYRLKALPAYGSEGKIAGYIAIASDITDSRKYEEELICARRQAELYIDLMGHDINNMNQIGIGFLEMALDRLDLDNEGQMLIRKPLEAMLNSSHLIDNVKKIRRANIGSSCLEPIDLGKTLEDVIRDYIDIPGRDAMIEYAPVHGYYVLANPLLWDIFSNLINNAFKHSTGPLKIWIKVSPADSDRTRFYRITIEDNGPGIPDVAKRVLLEHAYSLRKRAGGRGLGLYLVKVLVDSFKGAITVEDRAPGDARPGTRITITLPAVDGTAVSAMPPSSPVPEKSPGPA